MSANAIDDLMPALAARVPVDSTDARGKTALMWASETNQLDLLRILGQCGARVDSRNASGETALMLATSLGHAGCVEELLRLKAQ